MALRKKSQGSGLTETEALVAEGNLSNAEQLLFDEATALHEVEGRLSAIERTCVALLEDRGLPSGPCRYPGGFANEPWYALKAMGYAIDSPEGFAARMLTDVKDVRRYKAQGDGDRAIMHMFYLGAKWAASGIKERHGRKSRPVQPARKINRDVALAREFQRRRPHSRKSDSALMAEIGASLERPLSRSSAIAAVRRGLQILSG